jgi:glycosyltransferase involved in cell wall biosynthesis
MRILLWPIHGGYTDAFVRGAHEYLLAVTGDAPGEDDGVSGWGWEHAHAVPLRDLHAEDIDIVVLQRPEEITLVEELTGRVPGRDLPALYLEHNTPGPSAFASRHPLADQRDMTIVHVTHFNHLFWDNGLARTTVVEHGVPDPGPLYTGEIPRMGVTINEPVRRWRATGTDLLPQFAREGPVDVFGIDAGRLRQAFPDDPSMCPVESLPPQRLHAELAQRRLYVHPFRWTSLGLSLLEAMHLGMPVVGLATTEAVRAVPARAGVISTDVDELLRAARTFLHEPEWAKKVGAHARAHALEHYGLQPFLARWDEVLGETVDG